MTRIFLKNSPVELAVGKDFWTTYPRGEAHLVCLVGGWGALGVTLRPG